MDGDGTSSQNPGGAAKGSGAGHLPSSLVADLANQWIAEGRLREAGNLLRERRDEVGTDLALTQAAIRLAAKGRNLERCGALLAGMRERWSPDHFDDDIVMLAADQAQKTAGRTEILALLDAAGDDRSHQALAFHGQLRLLARQWERARDLLGKALKKAPVREKAALAMPLAIAEARSGDCARAFALMANHIPNLPPSPRWYLRAAEIALSAGKPTQARRWCTLAAAHGRGSLRLAIVRARAVLAKFPAASAVQDLAQLVKEYPLSGDLHHFLAVGHRKGDDLPAALIAAEEAVRLAPEVLEHWLLKSELLRAMGDGPAALDCLEAAGDAVRPGAGRAWLRQACAAEGGLVATASDLEHQIADLREVINHQPEMLPVAEGFAIPEMFRPSWTVEDIRRRRTVVATLRSHFNVFLALILRDIRARYSRNRLGYLWAVADPAVQVLVFFGIFTLVRGGRDLMGMSIPMFLVTGIVPFLMFQQTFSRINGCIKADRALLHHPHVRPMDIVLARAALELVTVLCVFALFLAILAALGETVSPTNFPRMMAALALLWAAGVGLGLTVEALTPVMRFLGTVVGAAVRILYFTSGAIFTVSMLPRGVLDYMLLNPLLHAVEIVRQSFSPFIHTHGVNLVYPALAVGWLVLFGLLANRAMEKRVLED